MSRKLIKDMAADGNAECVEQCRRAGRAAKLAIDSVAVRALPVPA
jgi:hypothetical protein